MKKTIFIAVCFAFTISCTRRITDFTIVSTKNFDLSKAGSFERGTERITGADRIHIIIFFPTGIPNLKEGIDRTIESIPGCVALLDGVAYLKHWWVGLYGQEAFVVEGTPLIDPNLVGKKTTKLPEYGTIKFNRKGELVKVEEISSVEYSKIKSKVAKGAETTAF